jgi:hypothetical protein
MKTEMKTDVAFGSFSFEVSLICSRSYRQSWYRLQTGENFVLGVGLFSLCVLSHPRESFIMTAVSHWRTSFIGINGTLHCARPSSVGGAWDKRLWIGLHCAIPKWCPNKIYPDLHKCFRPIASHICLCWRRSGQPVTPETFYSCDLLILLLCHFSFPHLGKFYPLAVVWKDNSTGDLPSH